MKNIFVTGGAGFIGSAVVRAIIQKTSNNVCVFDKLTYSGNLSSLAPVSNNAQFNFLHADICDRDAVISALRYFNPDIIINLAAETHVDRSIDGPESFVNTNIVGSFNLLEMALEYYRSLSQSKAQQFRFIHISTDEVFGSLGNEGLFSEETPYAPTSPYSASKASSDHLVRAWGHTYGLPVIITNCSNNYGPYHFPEKLIPLMITNAIEDKSLPLYGKGDNIRDWLYVEDHASALMLIAESGTIYETYNIGGRNEWRNIDVVHKICDFMNEFLPRPRNYRDLISYVEDRPGHDQRYAMDCSKIERELGWRPEMTFEAGIRKTVQWYICNQDWWKLIKTSKYSGERLGLTKNTKTQFKSK